MTLTRCDFCGKETHDHYRIEVTYVPITGATAKPHWFKDACTTCKIAIDKLVVVKR